MKKTVFDDFEKATLIAFIQEQGYFLRYKKDELLRRLKYLEWDRKTSQVQKVMDRTVKAMQEIDNSTITGRIKWFEAIREFDKAVETGKAIDKKYQT
jgi:hypothetical protein